MTVARGLLWTVSIDDEPEGNKVVDMVSTSALSGVIDVHQGRISAMLIDNIHMIDVDHVGQDGRRKTEQWLAIMISDLKRNALQQ